MIPSGGIRIVVRGKRWVVWGLRKQLEPVLADGRETLAAVRDGLGMLIALAAAILAVSLLTLAAVLARV